MPQWSTGSGAPRGRTTSLPAGPGLPGLPHYDLCGHLCGAGGGHLHIRRQHIRCHLGVAWAIRSCCATPCLRPAALQNPCSAPTKGGRYLRVGLIDVDSHNFPNLCLMKLSEYHTRRGDRVEWWDPVKQYDLVYKSRVFTDTYSKDTIQVNNRIRSSRAVQVTARRKPPA